VRDWPQVGGKRAEMEISNPPSDPPWGPPRHLLMALDPTMTNLLPGRNNFGVSTQEPFHQGQNGALYRTTLNDAKRPNSGTI
jgi:hypothetical protein